MKFSNLEFVSGPSGLGGIQAKTVFTNGFGASIIQSPYSYGGREGLYELAVLNVEGELDFSTPVTDDVLGYLSVSDVEALLSVIEALPPKGE